MGRIEEKKQEKKAKILRSAYELFTEKSIEETSVSDITGRAGVAKGTFYLYFRDKYRLYEELVASRSNDIIIKAMTTINKKIPKSDEDKIFALTDSIIDQLAEDTSLLKFISKNLSWGLFRSAMLNSSGSARVSDFEKIFSDFIIENGLLKYKDPELMIFMIVELVGSTCYSVILDGTPTDIDTLKPYLLKTISNILNIFYIENPGDRPFATELDVCS